MSNCDRIESALNGLTPQSKPADAAHLVQILNEVNGDSHILNSAFLRSAPDTAKEMAAKGVFTQDINPGIPGATASLQQKDGKPQFLELAEGDRKESLRLDPDSSEPVINSVSQSCSGKLFDSRTVLVNGKPWSQTFTVPNLSDPQRPLEIWRQPNGFLKIF